MQGCGERMQMADKLVNDLFVIFSALAQDTKNTLEKSLISKRGFHDLGNQEIEQFQNFGVITPINPHSVFGKEVSWREKTHVQNSFFVKRCQKITTNS